MEIGEHAHKCPTSGDFHSWVSNSYSEMMVASPTVLAGAMKRHTTRFNEDFNEGWSEVDEWQDHLDEDPEDSDWWKRSWASRA